MPKFSNESKERLATCHWKLQSVCRVAILFYDFKVIHGHRTVKEQQKLYAQGRTKPGNKVTNIDGIKQKSTHNHDPSLGVDLAPWPIRWEDTNRFYLLAGIIMAIAWMMRIELRWGGDWNRNWDLSDQSFNDLGHFEVINP